MFKVKKQRRRRSQLRLGAQAINYEATAFQPRFSITPALNFWQTRRVKLSSLLALALLGWVLYLLFTRPAFFVYTAEIRGNAAVSAREIYAISRIDSQSIFWINPAEVVKRITTLPNIKSASVSLTLPARVVIEVAERRPELLWQTGQTLWWVDQEGTVVPPKEDLTGMLRIIDDDRQPLQPGYQIDFNIVQGAQTLRVLAPDVSVIRHSRLRGLTVATPEGWPVYLGSGSEIKAKLVVLTAVLADLEERNITPAYIDMRDPLRPVYKPASVIQIGQPEASKPATPSPPRPTPR
ncbi:MAG: FtsQ-type POTRA domain-containing protein, partial [Chloroflexi bacterium]|nr:FtsQ-type POTRA domain-containing protein [Chloroflexota bacterium]